jgi:hypothetical protein
LGVPRDDVQADLRNRKAEKTVEHRDLIAATMTVAHIAEAQRLVPEGNPKRPRRAVRAR